MMVPIRDAATVMLVRDAADPAGAPAIEVCMLRRNLASEFVAGVYVFPGGAVDVGDGAVGVEALCPGLDDDRASTILGVERGGLAFWVAALRECFEEAGLLLARSPDCGKTLTTPPELLDATDPEVAAKFASYRDGLNDGACSFAEICLLEGLTLAVDTMHYVSRWITPELAPRRYDTRFFVAAAPPGQVARHDDSETIATIWVRPAEGLRRYEAGEIELLPPTVANLQTLVSFPTVAEAVAWAESVTEVVTVLPVVLIEDGRILLLCPGDEGYEQALAAREASGPEPTAELATAVRSTWSRRHPGRKREPR